MINFEWFKTFFVQKIINKEKESLILALKKNNAFWSYDLSDIQSNTISNEFLIESTLVFGDVDEIKKLFQIFSKKEIKAIWNKNLANDAKYYKLNYYLSVIFFNIKNPKKYIEENTQINSRYERLKQLSTNHSKSIS